MTGTIPKLCMTCNYDRFQHRPTFGRPKVFFCPNCGTQLELPDCDCPGTFCEHTPLPSQCE